MKLIEGAKGFKALRSRGAFDARRQALRRRARRVATRRTGRRRAARLSFALAVSLLLSGCFRGEEGQQFYGKVSVPATQELRWSDGGLPKIFDPARAAAPPDTDAVRALYEGLTDYEPGTLRPVPAVALRWESSDGGRRWTFHLRTDARWSNGDAVTAEDFVRSWQRTLRLGERAPHARLLANLEGAQAFVARLESKDEASRGASKGATPAGVKSPTPTPTPEPFGVTALDANTLRVTLRRPDNNFPALVAHPVFRPVHELSTGAGLSELQDEQANGVASSDLGLVTNGAFNLSRLSDDRVELERARNYWDADSVKLERVSFVNNSDAESALAAYRAGEIDAVTNAPFEPLAVKLLTPYKDFRRGTFAALNYYRFNTARPPFDDRRVREALAIAIDTERLSADTLGGATEPAKRFLPAPSDEDESAASVAANAPARDAKGASKDNQSDGGKVDATTGSKNNATTGSKDDPSKDDPDDSRSDASVVGDDDARGGSHSLAFDAGRARTLLAEAGYPGGVNFPRIRLLVNRNDQQRTIAQAVARMWREALGVETEIVVRPWDEYEAMMRTGDYDVARRSLVMQTTDEESNMIELFGDGSGLSDDAAATAQQTVASSTPAAGRTQTPSRGEASPDAPVLTEAQALRDLPAVPLHFASSYALVKPYVEGFESNLLDAPSLKNVRVNAAWRPPAESRASGLARALTP